MAKTQTTYSQNINISTNGNTDLIDITGEVENIVNQSKIEEGILCLFVIGSTASLTTIEFEPGLVQDIDIALEKIAPKNGNYEHHKTWGDDNGNSHVRASILGPSLSIPVIKNKMPLGTWQQIVLIDFDTRPRDRTIVVQIVGQ